MRLLENLVPGKNPLTMAIFNAHWPSQGRTFRCTDCGERFRATWRVGCFGPFGGQVKSLRLPIGLGRDERILCGRCGAEPWGSPQQQWLRQAQAEVGNRESGPVFVAEVRRATLRDLGIWATRLDLEAFRQLAPRWFDALWHQGSNPNPGQPLPRLQVKKVRLFLRMALQGSWSEQLPALPGPDPVVVAKRQLALRDHSRSVEPLAQQVAALGMMEVLERGTWPGGGLLRQAGASSDACYRSTGVDGACLAAALRRMPDLGGLARQEHAAELEQSLVGTVRYRLEMLLAQAGQAG